ncbi:hypothetical protein AOLI_G00018850 [Acnodon oligacanthus]
MDLHKALLKGDFSVIRRLIESGVDVNGRDAEGRTLLMLCCLHEGQDWAVGVARMLLMNKGQVGLTDSYGRSAFIYAVLYQRLGLVQMFLQALDFDLNARDLMGQTALDYANQTGNQAIKKLLLQAMKRCSSISGSSTTKPLNHKLLHSKNSLKSDTTITFTNLLPYKTLSKELWTNRETIQRSLGPKCYTVSKGTTKVASEKIKTTENLKRGDESSSLVQNPHTDTSQMFTKLFRCKTLSKRLWKNQDTVQRKLKSKHLPDPKAISKTVMGEIEIKSGYENSILVQNPKPDTINISKTHSKKLGTIQETAQEKLLVLASKAALEKSQRKPGDEQSPLNTPKDWRLDLRRLMDALQAQSSASYRPIAQNYPRAPRQHRRPSRAVKSIFMHKQKGRKMSLSALDDVLENERQISFCRRCTLASIPMIQLSKGRKPSIPGLENLRLRGERNVKFNKPAGNSLK